MIDRPERPTVLASIAYAVIAFYSFPFLLLLMRQGLFTNNTVTAVMEMVFHAVNFLVSFCIFRQYLSDSRLTFLADKAFFKTVAAGVGLMFAWVLYLFFVFGIWSSHLVSIMGFSALPLAESDLFTLSSGLIELSPFWGTLCMVLLAPFSTTLLYYATAFAPMACRRSWLGYAAVALYATFPRLCNGLTFWDPVTELVIYISQLPLHLIACWTYQKTDSVFAPIATIGAANLITCLILNLLRLF